MIRSTLAALAVLLLASTAHAQLMSHGLCISGSGGGSLGLRAPGTTVETCLRSIVPVGTTTEGETCNRSWFVSYDPTLVLPLSVLPTPNGLGFGAGSDWSVDVGSYQGIAALQIQIADLDPGIAPSPLDDAGQFSDPDAEFRILWETQPTAEIEATAITGVDAQSWGYESSPIPGCSFPVWTGTGIGTVSLSVGVQPDADGDGVPDASDNCTAVSNAGQADTDADGYGNACDCDFDNSSACDGTDFTTFAASFGLFVPPGNPDCDMDSSGAVGGEDFTLFAEGFDSGFPGPSCCSP